MGLKSTRKGDIALAALMTLCCFLGSEHQGREVVLAGADWVYYIIYIGISLLASYLLRPKNKSPVQDDKPTTLTTRGSYVPWFVGIRLVGPVFAWAGGREGRKESVSGGGKGGSSDKQKVYYETGWHLIGIGRVDVLHLIIEGGKVIFNGPINPVSHPSGSTIELSGGQSFTIYWGEIDQPVNTFLGDPNRLGITSRWPMCCYIQWHKKRLGTSPNWPILEYVLERRPSGAFLTQSEPWYESTGSLDPDNIHDIIGVNANADPDVGNFLVDGSLGKVFDAGRLVNIQGNSLPDGDYVIRRSVVSFDHISPGVFLPRTRIFLDAGTAGANDQGTLQTYVLDDNDGANIAHCVADMLFAEYPQGLGLDPAGLEPWDMDSLEALGVEAETELWRSSITSVNGENAEAILANILQDHGTMLPINLDTGAMLFQRVRVPSGTLPFISSDHEADTLPEIETRLGEIHTDEMIFSFADRRHGFADMTIAVSEDGHILYMDHARPRNVPISSTVNFATAGALSELRSQEELAGSGHIKLRCMRDTRYLIPGQAIVAESFEEVLRVLTVGFDPLSERVEIEVIPDFYGAPKNNFVNEEGGGQVVILDPQEDLQVRYIELPEQLLSTEEVFLVMPHIRAHAEVVKSSIWLSRDDITYSFAIDEDGYATGGLTDVALPDTSRTFLAQGPTFTLRGPDIGIAQDLSADPTNFGLGRQLCVIVSSAGKEICYVQKLTAVSGSQYRLDGLLRARFDTRKLDHPIGAEVYVFGTDTLTPFTDILMEPEELLYVKSQPFTNGGSLLLSEVTPLEDTLRGKGLRPIDPEGLRLTAPFKGVSVYRTGDDAVVAWNWSSALSQNTGAGFQNYGDVIGPEVIKGAFIVELLTPADVVVQTDTITVPTITYPAATLAAAPISNGNFKVRVKQSYNGYFSEEVTFTVTHI